jgi:hypothetical protein
MGEGATYSAATPTLTPRSAPHSPMREPTTAISCLIDRRPQCTPRESDTNTVGKEAPLQL